MSLPLTGRACPARPWNKAFPMPEAELLPQKPCATERQEVSVACANIDREMWRFGRKLNSTTIFLCGGLAERLD